MTIFSSSQPTFLIIPSWQLAVSMHQIGSLICNEHDKLMVKMTILFLLCTMLKLHTLLSLPLYYVLCIPIVQGIAVVSAADRQLMYERL